MVAKRHSIDQNRGRPLIGARAISEYIFGTPTKSHAIYELPREEFGLVFLNGKILGFTRWIDEAIAGRRKAGRRRNRSPDDMGDGAQA